MVLLRNQSGSLPADGGAQAAQDDGSPFGRARAWLRPLLLLIAAAVLGGGCGTPRHRADEFVGTWVLTRNQKTQTVLDLRGDGVGVFYFIYEPHNEAVYWSVKGDELILSPVDGTPRIECPYRLNNPNEIEVKLYGENFLLKRGQKAHPAEGAVPKAPKKEDLPR